MRRLAAFAFAAAVVGLAAQPPDDPAAKLVGEWIAVPTKTAPTEGTATFTRDGKVSMTTRAPGGAEKVAGTYKVVTVGRGMANGSVKLVLNLNTAADRVSMELTIKKLTATVLELEGPQKDVLVMKRKP